MRHERKKTWKSWFRRNLSDMFIVRYTSVTVPLDAMSCWMVVKVQFLPEFQHRSPLIPIFRFPWPLYCTLSHFNVPPMVWYVGQGARRNDCDREDPTPANAVGSNSSSTPCSSPTFFAWRRLPMYMGTLMPGIWKCRQQLNQRWNLIYR